MIRKLTIATYTPTQRVELEKFYQEFHEGESPKSPSDEKLKVEELSGSIGLTPDQIRMWCRNRKKRGAYKGRSALAVEQVRILEWLFTNHSNYPSTVLKKRVASELGITYSQLQVHFFSFSFISSDIFCFFPFPPLSSPFFSKKNLIC